MKKLTALLLALLMLTFAFASCNGDDDENTSPEGKTFAYEKNEIEFENEKIEAAFTALLAEGQTAGDYICETFFDDDIRRSVFTFKDGKMYSSNYTNNGEEIGFAYKMEGKEIAPVSSEGNSYYGGIDLTYERGKLICTIKIDFPRDTAMFIEFPTDSKEEGTLTLKYIYKEGNVPAIPPPPPTPAGKTFVFEKVELDETQENPLLLDADAYEKAMKDTVISFTKDEITISSADDADDADDGKSYRYTLEGDAITLEDSLIAKALHFFYKDGKLIMEQELSLLGNTTTIKYIFKASK